MPVVSDMVWDVGKRAQRNEAMSTLTALGFQCCVPPRRLGDRYTFCVSDVPDGRRAEVAALVVRIAPDATLQQ